MTLKTKQILIILISINFVLTQDMQSDIIIGKKDKIASSILKKDLNFQIYLPRSYATSKEEYPVLYLLDGQLHFQNAVAIQRSLDTPSDLPEMIIVGLENKYPRREDLIWNNKDHYISFLGEELIPFIEKTYRASKDRVLFGWEMGAYFSSYIAFKSELFSAVISSNAAYADENLIQEFKAKSTEKTKYFYMANSQRDIYTIDGSEDLNKLLLKHTFQDFKWKYERFNDETHSSLGYLALYHGLNYYYHDFAAIEFHSIKEFEELGGLKYLEHFFKTRSSRYDFPAEIDNSTKNTLIWLAWKRDNFKYFDYFMTEFKEVLETKRYASSYWQNRFGQFYLKHKKQDKAIAYFNAGLEKYTETAEAYNGLGHAYLQKNEMNIAKDNFEKAVKLAKTTDDEMFERYEKDLMGLTN